MPIISRPLSVSRIKDLLLLLSAIVSFSLLLHLHHLHLNPSLCGCPISEPPPPPALPLTLDRLLFSIASSTSSFASRAPYRRLWHNPISHLNTTFLFLDRPLHDRSTSSSLSFPHIVIPGNVSILSSGHRIAHIVKDAFALNIPDISWYVFGDDDTVFFTDNVVKILSKYDHSKWYYIGYSSESYEQNEKFYFDMAYGGGGFALSAPLVRVLARVLDSCLERYSFLYGSDARIFACLSELGVKLTAEPGFHQVDVRGDLFGLLSAHPRSLAASLHHIDALEPIFPGMSRLDALEHLFKAVNADSFRLFQQSVCYDPTNSLTVSISWGYSLQVYEGNHLLPELLSRQRTFRPWKRGRDTSSSHFMFNTREFPNDPCKRPLVFFLNSVASNGTGVWTNYTRYDAGKCDRTKSIQKLEAVTVFSPKLDFGEEQTCESRRHCCDTSSSFEKTMSIRIRKCGTDELIVMQR